MQLFLRPECEGQVKLIEFSIKKIKLPLKVFAKFNKFKKLSSKPQNGWDKTQNEMSECIYKAKCFLICFQMMDFNKIKFLF